MWRALGGLKGSMMGEVGGASRDHRGLGVIAGERVSRVHRGVAGV